MTEATGTTVSLEIPNLDGARAFDAALIPADARLDLLKTAVRNYIANRVNAAYQRHQKASLAWTAYDEASKADPLQSAVSKPEGDRPTVDLEATFTAAIADLTAGSIRQRGKGEGRKARVTKDPLVEAVTSAVVREIFEAGKKTDPKYTFLKARADVGGDGVAFLKSRIAAKVAAGADAAPLEKMLEERYMKPARIMIGQGTGKALTELPSIL